MALREIESDLADQILAPVSVPWTDAFRESEDLAAAHVEAMVLRSIDLLHVGVAIALKATEVLTYDVRQIALSRSAGLQVRP